jgi:branched-chain amino acid transport system ATP-binding protein
VRSFQISAVFGDMSVLDNLRIALFAKHGQAWNNWGGARAIAAFDAEALELIERFGLSDFASIPANTLPYGRKRALELATTLARDPVVLLLDEPTQGMGVEDVSHITTLIKEAAVGRTVVMVEHNLKVVSSLADTITVLARGRKISEGSYAEVSEDPLVREAYLGHPDTGGQG